MTIGVPHFSPGTVSRILWHFSGGPVWDPKTRRQAKTPKPEAKAYEALCSIVASRELRLGSYREVVTAVFPEKKVKNPASGKFEMRPSESMEIQAEPVCCLSDIPAPHLGYHAARYGKFAVGFHRDAAVHHGFNPVFYSLDNTGVVRSMHDGFSQLEFVDPSGITAELDAISSDLADLEPEVEVDVSSSLIRIESEVSDLEDSIASATESLSAFLAFVKTFRQDEFESIYCEREWRALQTFAFDVNDIAMIVLPRLAGTPRYFEDFVNRVVPACGLPRSVPVVPWEDLIEH